MSRVRDELRYWVEAARGALKWHAEAGELGLSVPEGYAAPPLGRVPAAPRSSAADSPPSAAPPSAPPQASPPSSAPPQTSAPAQRHDPAPNNAAFRPEPPPAQPSPAPAPTDAAPPPVGAPAAAAALQALRDEIGACERCRLCGSRTELVFGVGRPDARVMFVGEAPRQVEDATGLPFVDEAGALLGRMVRAMGLQREQAYLTHLVKCSPGRGAPDADSVATCQQFLRRQVRIVRPEAIVALGEGAARVLTGEQKTLPHVRGRWAGPFEDVPVMPTFAPRALLQSPEMKGHVWEDLKKVMRRLDLSGSRR